MKKRPEQLEFAEIQSRKLSRSTQKMVRHDFEQVLTACARLASFSGGARMRSDGPIDERQEELAIDDLVLFGIHARRLIENTTGKRRFSRVAVPLYRPKLAGREVTMWRIINTIVHYELIEIIRSEGHLRAALSPKFDLSQLLDGSFSRHISPLMILQSPESKPILIEIRTVIEIFQKRILSPIVDACMEQSFFLVDDLKDL